jgi:type 1 glutamine amidotransferase
MLAGQLFDPGNYTAGAISHTEETPNVRRNCRHQRTVNGMKGQCALKDQLSVRTLRVAAAMVAAVFVLGAAAPQDVPHLVTYEGTSGPGAGKHVVLIAGDHEYRSEEVLPALGRILAREFGFKASVFFTLDDDGFIEPGSSNIAGLEALETADLLIVGLRFQDFPEDEMQHIVNYLGRGGPIVGIRTSTHAFRLENSPFLKYTWDYDGAGYEGGFGRQVLGETWVGHYGTNHEQSSRILANPEEAAHPILRGVRDMHVQSGGYRADPMPGSVILGYGQVLNGLDADAPRDIEKEQLPVAWTRTYPAGDGTPARVFTTTHGASEDFLNDGFRRMMVNASLWAAGLEDAITADLDVSLIGPYNPVTFAFDGYRRGVRPIDMAGFDTPIMDPSKPTSEPGTGSQAFSVPGRGERATRSKRESGQ